MTKQLRKTNTSDDPLLAVVNLGNSMTKAQIAEVRKRRIKALADMGYATHPKKGQISLRRGIELNAASWPIVIPDNLKITKCETATVYMAGAWPRSIRPTMAVE